MGESVSIVFWVVVATRFVLPLWIPMFPLPAIVGCLIVDAIDQPIFQTFTHVDLSAYQSYDKALDIFYLSIATLTMYRNWKSLPAIQVGRALFYLRLVGVLAFETTGWRWLLFLFPNAFEYYFIFYEAIRTRWTPARLRPRFYMVSAAVIWILKLPQEYWIHIAKLDVTDEVKHVVLHMPKNASWVASIAHSPISFGLMVAAACTFIIMGSAANPSQLVLGTAAIVTINAFLRLRGAAVARQLQSGVLSFLLLGATNAVIVAAAATVLRGHLDVTAALFFLLLLTLVVTLYDRWRPIFDFRFVSAFKGR